MLLISLYQVIRRLAAHHIEIVGDDDRIIPLASIYYTVRTSDLLLAIDHLYLLI